MPVQYAYTGWEERIFSSYLRLDGNQVSTLIGIPGMDPVEILRAAGNEGLPEYPLGGWWVPSEPTSQAESPVMQESSHDAVKDNASQREEVTG